MEFFRNSMRPDWIVTGDRKHTQKNVERIKKALRKHYAGKSMLGGDVARIWERFNVLTDRVNKQVELHELTPNQARQVLASLAESLGLDPTPWRGDLPDGDTFPGLPAIP
jgi:hypothetical protein